jgi:1,2-phenylacetyl-CoA epoxidase catalytic subunit
MRLAGQCFESKNFKMAETHLVGAVDFYTRMFGPNHQATAAATQNLGIARQNAILQLWREVAAEEIEKRAGQGPEDISEKNQGDWERELALIGATAETKDASACSIC